MHITSTVDDINLDNFGFGYAPSNYPAVINLLAELVPSHGAPRRLGNYQVKYKKNLHIDKTTSFKMKT